jgi:hypothetical protein
MRYMQLKLDDYPDNYLDTYIDNIRKVTKADIQTAAKKCMDPEKMTVLVVGDEKRFDKPLASFGKVKELELKKIIEEERGAQKYVAPGRRMGYCGRRFRAPSGSRRKSFRSWFAIVPVATSATIATQRR